MLKKSSFWRYLMYIEMRKINTLHNSKLNSAVCLQIWMCPNLRVCTYADCSLGFTHRRHSFSNSIKSCWCTTVVGTLTKWSSFCKLWIWPLGEVLARSVLGVSAIWGRNYFLPQFQISTPVKLARHLTTTNFKVSWVAGFQCAAQSSNQ